MIEISVCNNRGFSWTCSQCVYVKGYLFSESNQFKCGKDLVDFFSGLSGVEDFYSKIASVNGSFCVIVKLGDVYYVAVDRVRSFPCYIYIGNGIVHISDDIHLFQRKYNLTIDELAREQICSMGYAIGDRTLFSEVKQVCAGSYVVISPNGFTAKRYYKYVNSSLNNKNKSEIFSDLIRISDRVFDRLIKSVNGKQVVVPLSGGFDSRYVVAWLKRMNYKNVICFTYGRKDSFEVKISKKIARALDYDWYFVEYTDDVWESVFQSEWWPFFKYAGQLSQSPHEQDIYAINTLKNNNIIDDDAVIVPGYFGDYLSGKHIYANEQIRECSIHGLVQQILTRYYFGDEKNRALIENSIIKSLECDYCESNDSYNNIIEDWLFSNRWTKYVINAVRGYDFHELEWRMPLADRELMDYWNTIPNKYRYGEKKWYNEFLMSGIFKEYGIDIHTGKSKWLDKYSVKVKSHIKKMLYYLIGNGMTDKLRRKIMIASGNDMNNSSHVCDYLTKTISLQDKFFDKENTIVVVALWYLLNVEKIDI